MANKVNVATFLTFEGDGASNTLAANLLTQPFAMTPANGGQLSPAFGIGVGNLPTAIKNVVCSGGLSVSAALGVLGAITFTFTGGPPANGTKYLLGMDLEF
jgi:hypothetical protein